ncbi:hypothetical protein [Vibrio mexicanus]|uniref:cyanobactin maturation protease PatG family protein n=1 Tax=Vibrio mexicanus TaxID=1004326 RepID=UPI00063C7700|nr:hypothetical protein [Vibrio mexicanus]
MTQDQISPNDAIVGPSNHAQIQAASETLSTDTTHEAQPLENQATANHTVQKAPDDSPASSTFESAIDDSSTSQTTSVNIAPQESVDQADNNLDENPDDDLRTAMDAPSYIYALGRVQAQFPSKSIENLYKEVVFQKFGPAAASKSQFDVLSLPEHRFLARKMCWTLTIDGHDCYVLNAKTPALLDAFIAALESKSNQQFDYVIAHLGSYATDNQCNGRSLQIAHVHQVQSFTAEDYCQVLSQQTEIELSKIKPLFNSMLKFCRNSGSTPAQRALNYVSLKCTSLYKTFTAPMLAQNKDGIEFEQIEAQVADGSHNREVICLIFSYLNPESKRVDKQHINIDVTELYPFSCSELIFGEPQV